MSECVLIIDDEPDIGELIANVARGIGIEAKATSKLADFFAAYDEMSPTLIVTDLAMPECDGIEILHQLDHRHCKAKIIVISGFDEKVLKTAQGIGSDLKLKMIGAIQKPIMIDALEEMISSACQVQHSLTGDDFRKALSNGEIVPYLQPKASLNEWRVGEPFTEAEALVRWDHPERGVLSPAAFLPLVEEIGALEKLTDTVVVQVTRQLSKWKKDNYTPSVAINLSPQLLSDKGLPDRYTEIIAAKGLTPSSISFEVTEMAAIENVQQGTEVLTRLRIKGFKLALDDFGTGFSSMVQLYRMPFSELKIDQSFIMDIEHSDEAKTIVKASIDLAHNLGLSVCAEGVETISSLRFLKEHGCDIVQGYLIGRPGPAPEFKELRLNNFLNPGDSSQPQDSAHSTSKIA